METDRFQKSAEDSDQGSEALESVFELPEEGSRLVTRLLKSRQMQKLRELSRPAGSSLEDDDEADGGESS